VDRIFGRGTTPREVASYLVHAVLARPTTPPPPLAGPKANSDDHPAATLDRTGGHLR
jgi:hypothetical protein